MGLGWHPIYEMKIKDLFETTSQFVYLMSIIFDSWIGMAPIIGIQQLYLTITLHGGQQCN